MREFLHMVVDSFTATRDIVNGWNSEFACNFSDKELHFIIIGVLGMLMLLCVYPLFRWLSKKGFVMGMALIYVATLLTVIAFAIEIGQKATNTGTMDFNDILYGLAGFVVFFGIAAVVFKFIGFARRKISGAHSSNGYGHRSDTV